MKIRFTISYTDQKGLGMYTKTRKFLKLFPRVKAWKIVTKYRKNNRVHETFTQE